MFAYTRVQHFLSLLSKKCRLNLRSKNQPTKQLEISAPFDFKKGPLIEFPGYSFEELSLMKEKAIASTAVFEDDLKLMRRRSLTWCPGAGFVSGKGVGVSTGAL